MVKYRNEYLEKLAGYDREAPNISRPLIKVYYDELTFYANADQAYYCSGGQFQVLQQKSLGQAVMVSDFIAEVSSFLKDGEDTARESIEHQTEGYWNNDKLLDQVNRAINIFERMHPQSQGLFFF